MVRNAANLGEDQDCKQQKSRCAHRQSRKRNTQGKKAAAARQSKNVPVDTDTVEDIRLGKIPFFVALTPAHEVALTGMPRVPHPRRLKCLRKVKSVPTLKKGQSWQEPKAVCARVHPVNSFVPSLQPIDVVGVFMRNASVTTYSQIEMNQEVLAQLKGMAFKPCRLDRQLGTSPYSPLHSMPMTQKQFVPDPFKKIRLERRRRRRLRRLRRNESRSEKERFFADTIEKDWGKPIQQLESVSGAPDPCETNHV